MATRLDPFRELERLFDQTVTGARTGIPMPMDLFRTGDHYVIRVDLPGADPGSIDVTVDDRMLTIRGERTATDNSDGLQWLVQERPTGTFARQVALGHGLSTDNINATYTDGVLTLSIPVAQEAKPRRIEVSHTGNDVSDHAVAGSNNSQQQIEAN